MKAEEVVFYIDYAIQCIKEYKEEKEKKTLKLKSFRKTSSLNENLAKKDLSKIASDDESILEESRELIKEAFMLGQAGQADQTCPRCGGTGLV